MTRNLNKLFHKSAGIVSNVISAPSRVKSKLRGASADRKRKVITHARKFDKAPSFVGRKPTEAFKARTVAKDVIKKEKKRVAKKVKRMNK